MTSTNVIKRILKDTYSILIHDEDLLRLVYYPPVDYINVTKHALDRDLPNIQDYWEIDGVLETDDERDVRVWGIRNHHIIDIRKSDDTVDGSICRLYIYAGKSRPTFHNKTTTRQEIVVDIFCHSRYEEDYRMEDIRDRVNKLLIGREGIGLGKIDSYSEYDFVAPKEYTAYRHVYEVLRSKSWVKLKRKLKLIQT